MADKTFPQDDGSSQHVLEDEADYADAGHLSAHVHSGNTSDYVVAGHTLSADFPAGEVTVSAGQTRILVENNQSKDHGDGTTVWEETTVVVRKDGETLDLAVDAENHIWLDARLDEGDDPRFEVTEGADPGGETLRIGVVNTAEQSTQHVNRNPDGDYGDLTVEGLASIERAHIKRLADTLDGDGESITGLAGLTTAQATVENEPTQDDHAARKAELDQQLSHGDQQRLEAGGEDELDLTGLEGETATPQPPKPHNNDAHSEDFVSPETADSALQDATLHARAFAVPAEDLSSLSLSSEDDGGLFYHDGTSTISMVDGTTSSNTGYYRYRHSDSRWRKVGDEAMLLDGHQASAFALVDGDTFTGPVNIRTVSENALLYLRNEDPGDYPEVGLGNSFDEGMKMRYYEADNEVWFGRFTDSGGFLKDIGFDLEAGEVIT